MQCDAYRCLRIARLHAQVEVQQGTAAIAGYHKPRMPSGEGGADLRPEPCLPLGRKPRIEATYRREGVALGFPGALHPFDGLDAFMALGAAVLLGLFKTQFSSCSLADEPRGSLWL